MYCEKETLGEFQGQLCVVYGASRRSEPVIVRYWWPIGNQHLCDWEAELGERLTNQGRPSDHYSFMDASKWPSVEFILRNGVQTQPIHSEASPYKCPKVPEGTETRYRDGQWEKYHKSRGWVAV